jgi:hypothetical protein
LLAVTIPAWLSWLIALLHAWLGIRADIQQKQAEHVGEVVQQNADLTAELKTEKDALDVENKVAGMSPAAVDAELRSKWK